jgi:hypothetical protein
MFAGIAAPTTYAIAVVLGGVLWPAYSHFSQPISDLIADGAPTKRVLDPLFALYNLLTLAFGVGMLRLVRTHPSNTRQTLGLFGAYVLLAEGVFGFLTLFFPEGPGGMNSKIEITGMFHIALAALSSLTSMLSVLPVGLWLRSIPTLRTYGAYSLATVAFIFLTGGASAAVIATQGAAGGLLERLTIGGFLQWLIVLALLGISLGQQTCGKES